MSEKEKTSTEQPVTGDGISRRDMLLGMSAVAGMAYAGFAVAASKEHDDSKHATQMPELMDAVNNCPDKGRRWYLALPGQVFSKVIPSWPSVPVRCMR